MQRPRPPHPAHDLVKDQQRSVPRAHRLDRAQVALRRGHASQRRADHGLEDYGCDGGGAEGGEGGFELGCFAGDEGGVGFGFFCLFFICG